ncbi:hypothetical protein BKA69DRAFT_845612 [Paraphysoderma sedebokerense]|nr:hypothetical protein BKA69DRAFT_845612 [Paraphysoderma sedebokerense]
MLQIAKIEIKTYVGSKIKTVQDNMPRGYDGDIEVTLSKIKEEAKKCLEERLAKTDIQIQEQCVKTLSDDLSADYKIICNSIRFQNCQAKKLEELVKEQHKILKIQNVFAKSRDLIVQETEKLRNEILEKSRSDIEFAMNALKTDVLEEFKSALEEFQDDEVVKDKEKELLAECSIAANIIRTQNESTKQREDAEKHANIQRSYILAKEFYTTEFRQLKSQVTEQYNQGIDDVLSRLKENTTEEFKRNVDGWLDHSSSVVFLPGYFPTDIRTDGELFQQKVHELMAEMDRDFDEIRSRNDEQRQIEANLNLETAVTLTKALLNAEIQNIFDRVAENSVASVEPLLQDSRTRARDEYMRIVTGNDHEQTVLERKLEGFYNFHLDDAN